MTKSARTLRMLRSLIDPRTYVHALKLLNFYSYAHVTQMTKLVRSDGVRIAPNASFRAAEHITLGERTHIGERSMLWAGDGDGTITVGCDCLIAPEVMIVATNYSYQPGELTRESPKREAPVTIGDNVWIGARVVITAGVRIGANAVIGAGSVVTSDIPANSLAVGVPARVVRIIGAADRQEALEKVIV